MHPLFPSGEWKGFYTYRMGPGGDKHEMQFLFEFQDGQISGMGSDPVGAFTWKGSYQLKALIVNMTKSYPTHWVEYQGHVDENGIWGTWTLSGLKGGFHVWPINGAEEKTETEALLLKKV